MAVASRGEATLIKALGGRVSHKSLDTVNANEPLGGFRSVTGVPMWNDLGFKDVGDVRAIPLDRFEDAVVPTGALKNISRCEGRHGSW